jgi:hypothetical protein
MRRVLLIFLSLVLAFAGGTTVGAEDNFYVIPAMRGKYAPVPKTGQTAVYGTRDDGALQKGVASPTPRFTDHGNGTVTDNLTKLIWMKNASAIGKQTWANALSIANNLQSGEYDLTDGSVAGDWRLPNIRELQTLIDYSRACLCLPEGHPFTWVNDGMPLYYWASTSYAYFNFNAWRVDLFYCQVGNDSKSNTNYVWCVRGGP